ncbi:hypothetical protein Y032_0026g1294 [Ancylostoma ceylanicum]|nr:hypothetical protein Y032_0026g1294 [Ancylostoma ceylanicum]
MAQAFERVLLDAAYCDLTIEDEEDIEEDNDEKMDVDWDIYCENIETRSSPSNTPFIEFGGKPISIEQNMGAQMPQPGEPDVVQGPDDNDDRGDDHRRRTDCSGNANGNRDNND